MGIVFSNESFLAAFFAYFTINYTNNYYNSKNYKWNLTESKFLKWNTRYLFRWKFLQVWREHWLVEKGMGWDRKNDCFSPVIAFLGLPDSFYFICNLSCVLVSTKETCKKAWDFCMIISRNISNKGHMRSKITA